MSDELDKMRANRLRGLINRGPVPYDRDFIREIGMGDIDDLRMVHTRWVSDQRKPCRRGEYIVIHLGSLNTLMVCNAANADNALLWRIRQITEPANRSGRWLVTNGKVAAIYGVQRGQIERLQATWLGDYEHE